MQSILRIYSEYRFDYSNKARNTTDRDRTQSLQPIRQQAVLYWKNSTSHKCVQQTGILLLCRQGDVIDDDDAHLKISVRLISTHQVGQKGTPLAVRCATNKGAQSIDMHAGSTGQQPAVGGQQPTLTAAAAAASKCTGQQPAADGQQPTVEGQQPSLSKTKNEPSNELGGSTVFGAAAQRTLQQPIAEPFTGGAGRQEQQEQAKFKQQLSAGWVQSQSRLTADR